VHKQRISRYVVEQQALRITFRVQQEGRGVGRSSYHGRGRGRGIFGFNKSILKCYNCHELGHFQ
jgi:hypothetical protein